MRWRRRDTIYLLASGIALALGAANKIRLGPPPDAQPHMERVRLAAQQVIGAVPGMIVEKGETPRQAFDLLQPNVLEAHIYTDLASGSRYSVLLVHCGDIADMGAHYPPACYPGSGLQVTTATPMALELGTHVLNGVEYELTPSGANAREPIRIWNCMFLTGGMSTYQPPDLRARAREGAGRFYGSGQIQVLVAATMSTEQRLTIYRQALAQYQPAIEVMLDSPAEKGMINNSK